MALCVAAKDGFLELKGIVIKGIDCIFKGTQQFTLGFL